MRLSPFLRLGWLALVPIVACGDSSSTGSGGAAATTSATTGSTGSTGTGSSAGGGAPTMCKPGETRACYSGPTGSQGIGACVPGVETCNPTGDGFGACTGEIVPVIEDCASPTDESCDGKGCGESIWSHALGNGLYGGAGAAMDLVDWNGDVLVGGTFQSSDPMLLNGTGWLRYHADGTFVEARKLQSNLTVLGVRVSATSDGGLVYGASGATGIDFGGGPLDGLAVAKLDAMGKHVWSKAFAASYLNDFLTDMKVSPTGDVAVVGITLDGMDFGGGMLAVGGYVATLKGTDGSYLHQAALGPGNVIPALAALPDGRFAVAVPPSLRIFNADLTVSCTSALAVNNVAALATMPNGDLMVAITGANSIQLVRVTPDCTPGTPVVVTATGGLLPKLAPATNGDFFLSYRTPTDHAVSRRNAAGAEVWTKLFPSSGVNDHRISIFGGISPIVLSLNLGSGNGIDYGNGPLPLGAALARIAP